MPAISRDRVKQCLIAASLATAIGLGAKPAAALIVTPVDSTDITSPPPGNPYWANVADRGIYLGNRWMLTVNHVGPGDTFFPGLGTFSYESGTYERMQNPTGLDLTTYADVGIYRLTADPGLPWLTLAIATPPIGAEVMFIGDGASVSADASETHWKTTGPKSNLVWHDASYPDGVARAGYVSTTGGQTKWGTNLVEDADAFYGDGQDPSPVIVANSGNGDTLSFFTEFDEATYTNGPVTSYEAQALGGDSGSAAFYKDGDTWVLAGVIHAVDIYSNQPSGTGAAIYGNQTFAADLTWYRDQILSIAAIPEVSSFWLLAVVAVMAAAAHATTRRQHSRRQT